MPTESDETDEDVEQTCEDVHRQRRGKERGRSVQLDVGEHQGQHEEECDEDGHAGGDDQRGDEVRDVRDEDDAGAGDVVLEDIRSGVSNQLHSESRQ